VAADSVGLEWARHGSPANHQRINGDFNGIYFPLVAADAPDALVTAIADASLRLFRQG
jgi:hypothetical protein